MISRINTHTSKFKKHPWTAAMKICYTNRGLLMLTREEIQMSEQQFTDFFDPEIQKIVSEDGCSIYRMKNVTGEGVITRYEILPGIELSYLILRALAKVLHISLDTLINPDISLEDEGVNQMKMLYSSCPPEMRDTLLHHTQETVKELTELSEKFETN